MNGSDNRTFTAFVVDRAAPVGSFVISLSYVIGFFVQLQEQATKLGFRVFAFSVVITFALLVWYVFHANIPSRVKEGESLPRFNATKRYLACAALILSLVPLGLSFRSLPDLRVLHVEAGRMKDGRSALQITLQNISHIRQPLTSLNITFWQESPLLTIGSTVYDIATATVDVSSEDVTAVVTPLDPEKLQAPVITLPVSGYFTQHIRGAWYLSFAVPLVDQLNPGDSHRIIIVLPPIIQLAGAIGGMPAFGIPGFSRNESAVRSQPKEFTFSDFVGHAGLIGVVIKITYNVDDTFRNDTTLSFTER